MAIIRKLTDLQLGTVYSNKVISITSSETLYSISTGARAFEVANNGTNSLVFYGGSGLAANSGGILLNTGGGAKFWDTVADNFQMAFRAGSGGQTVQLVIQEYAGN